MFPQPLNAAALTPPTGHTGFGGAIGFVPVLRYAPFRPPVVGSPHPMGFELPPDQFRDSSRSQHYRFERWGKCWVPTETLGETFKRQARPRGPFIEVPCDEPGGGRGERPRPAQRMGPTAGISASTSATTPARTGSPTTGATAQVPPTFTRSSPPAAERSTETAKICTEKFMVGIGPGLTWPTRKVVRPVKCEDVLPKPNPEPNRPGR